MLCRIVTVSSKKKTGAVPVYLNVYDLTPINGYAYWFGLGVYHSGVQVHGVEYAFGAHEHSTTGIFEVEPKQCPGFTYRKSILIGRTNLSPREIRSFMEKLAEEYSGNTYHLIMRNCNHFCNDVCLRLTGKPIPRWVNRLARLGFLCNCVLPVGLNEMKVGQMKPEKKKLRSQSSRYPSGSNSAAATPPLNSKASNSRVRTSKQTHSPPPSSSLLLSSTSSTFLLKL
ncbi:deSI-like protein At4g17486 [Cucurbita pepo subsp. pepo]|uniref:DeSI-like protein At4g17486 n=2 Tax=Cucurbita TaxID=3660 RepID=A0A6J1GJJ4_CUCMO|nr:deSI-like protein At4g17486 [Cucurbita moschata]XP_023537125.1 deSI-like protein At4g17486 [Cucurbita pepo subsp. pepo]